MTQDLAQELYPIYPMMRVPFWQTTPFYAALGLLVALTLGGLCWWLWRLYRLRKSKRTAWDLALEELSMLHKMYGTDQAKEFYLRLTALLKKYLHARFGYDIYSKTDQEMLAHLASVKFPTDLLEQLSSVVEGSVLVRFANAQVIQEQMQRDFNTSLAIIRKTIPRTQ